MKLKAASRLRAWQQPTGKRTPAKTESGPAWSRDGKDSGSHSCPPPMCGAYSLGEKAVLSTCQLRLIPLLIGSKLQHFTSGLARGHREFPFPQSHLS